jgi:ATP-binding cassette, subfamily B, bacterial PglK
LHPLLLDLSREIRRTLSLAQRFGGGRLGAVAVLSAAQGVAQMAAAGSMMPFLTLATSPDPSETTVGRLLGDLSRESAIALAGFIALLLQVLAGSLGLAGDYSRSRFAHLTAQRLSTEMMTRIAAQPYLAHLQTNVALHLKRLRDDVQVFLIEVLLPLMDAIVRAATAVLLIAVLFVINPLATVILGSIFGGIYAVVLVRLRGYLLQANRRRAGLVRRQFHTAAELLNNIKILMVTGSRRHFVDRYAEACRDLAANETPVSVLRVAPRMFMEMLAFAALVLVILGIHKFPSHAADWLPLTGTFAMAGYRLLPSLSLVYSQMVSFLTRKAVVDEILHTLNSTGSGELPAASASPLRFAHQIELRIPGFQFPGQNNPALGAIDLVVPKGSHTGILGPSGAGKSTILDLFLGLHTPSSGGVYVDEELVTPATMESWRALIGYVPQDTQLLDGTIRENILFGRPLDEALLREVTQIAQLHDFIHTQLVDGFDTVAGDQGIQVSGGQRQRIALARALYRSPEVLIFDEATSALDQATERAVLRALQQERPGLTILTVAHRPAAVRQAQNVILLDRGRIADQGTFEELETRTSLFRSLVQSTDAA